MLENIWIGILLVLFLGTTILVHEFGHYLVARLLGLVVETFSIGFGPAIWKKKYKGIIYKIGWIPFGGYVALPQLDPAGMNRIQASENDGEKPEEPAPVRLPSISPWKKILVSFAGGVGNIILAVIIAWIVYLVGMPATPADCSAAVGYVEEGGEAHRQGLRMLDVVASVNGKAVENWRDVRMAAATRETVVLIAVSPANEEKTVTLTTEKGMMGGRGLPGVGGRSLCQILQVVPDSSAEKAGIKSEDIIVEFAGKEVISREHLSSMVMANTDKEVSITVKRRVSGELNYVESKITPRYVELYNGRKVNRTMIGVAWNTRAVELDLTIHPKPMEQLKFHSSAIFGILGALTSPKRAKVAQEAIGGPVAVMLGYWIVVKTSVMLAVWFTGFLNVNLAIINLLPIPVLDGGHIVFSLWEIITRRPVSERVANALVNIFMVLLLTLVVFLSIRDVGRMTSFGRKIKTFFSTNNYSNSLPAQVMQEEPVTNAVP